MRLGIIFVATLAISVILSSTATWGLTYSTSYSELREMSSGFVQLAGTAVDDFGQLVSHLISDSGTLVSNILDTEYERSMIQLNSTGMQFLLTTIDLMDQAKNATIQAQGVVAALLVAFGNFMQTVLTGFKAVGTDDASRLRMESASRTQTLFQLMLQGRITAVQRQARLYELGMLNFSRRAEDPMDADTCTSIGNLCTASEEIDRNLFIGMASGNIVHCDVNELSFTRFVKRGPTADRTTLLQWAPFDASDPNANFSGWKRACLAGTNLSFLNVSCDHGTMMDYPTNCNGTCGFDPRCRPWYVMQNNADALATGPKTMMSPVYVDVLRKVPIVSLGYPIYSGPPRRLVAVAGTDVWFSDVDAFLSTLGSGGIAQLAAVVFNSSDLMVVGTSRSCANATERSPGKPIAQSCDGVLQLLGGWLALNRNMTSNVSLELNGTLWDVFPAAVDTFSYFVAVGMNKTDVYAVITASNLAAQSMLQTLSTEQAARMAASEKASLEAMDAMATSKVASLQAMQADLALNMQDAHAQASATFNTSRQQSVDNLRSLINNELDSIRTLEDYHLSQVVRAVGMTFAAAVGIFAGILLIGAYGTWAVTKQVLQIAQVMEDVALMRVEELKVSQKSGVDEVRRIEAALGVLVLRLAEYKSYMPAGLFQQEKAAPPLPDACGSACSPALVATGKQPTCVLTQAARPSVALSSSTISATPAFPVMSVAGAMTRLLRRAVAVMAVNVVHFQAAMAKHSAVHLEAMLNYFVSTVHSAASKAQGNLDAVVGDQVLVTFNAHFTCADPYVAASNVALELAEFLPDDAASPGRFRIGVAAGPVYVGHLGYAPFKSMVALGAPMKVASLLSHLSGFDEPAVLVCPIMEERTRFQFVLRPADLVALPAMGDFVALYAQSITVFLLEGQNPRACGSRSQEWVYEVGADEPAGDWAVTFDQVAQAETLEKARGVLEPYLEQHPEDPLAQRLLARLPHWQPCVGIVLAERPDARGEVAPHPAGSFPDEPPSPSLVP